MWWVTVEGADPVGPVTQGLLARGVAAGRVPDNALACRVGSQRWVSVALALTGGELFDLTSERVRFDLEPLAPDTHSEPVRA
jgi:hypothetical protein